MRRPFRQSIFCTCYISLIIIIIVFQSPGEHVVTPLPVCPLLLPVRHPHHPLQPQLQHYLGLRDSRAHLVVKDPLD